MAPTIYKPSAKPLSGRYLLLGEREEIALMRVQGYSMQAVARRLGRAASTISRELRRNAATRSGDFQYRATTAQWHAERSARRPKPGSNQALRDYVHERLAGLVTIPDGAALAGPPVTWNGRRHGRRQERRWARAWSPEQIARRLPIDFPDDSTMRISHEAIYQSLFIQGRGALRREGLKVPYKPKKGRLWLNDGSCIRLRPEHPNHVWSYDFVEDRTHNGRKFRRLNVIDEFTRECLAIRIDRKVNSTTVIDVLSDLFVLRGVPGHVRSDNGPEFVAKTVRDWIASVGARTAFIEPDSPWENGYCESFNSKLRDELLRS